MKNKKTDIYKRIVGLVGAIVLIASGIKCSEYILRPTDTDLCINAIETFHNMPIDSLDVIGYGSSHMWRGLDPSVLYDEYGINVYNYGCNWQQINTTLLFLKDSLKTQKPKVALFEAYLAWAVKKDVDVDGEIYYTSAIESSADKRKYLAQCFNGEKERYLAYYMPLCAFHSNWANIDEASFMSRDEEDFGFDKSRGYIGIPDISPIEIPDYTLFSQEELSDDAIEVLDEIVETCKENNIEVIFYLTPYGEEYLYSDAMKQYANDKGVVYLDLFEKIDEIGLDGNTDFYDLGHLNTEGAKKVSRYLGQYLIDNYDVRCN